MASTTDIHLPEHQYSILPTPYPLGTIVRPKTMALLLLLLLSLSAIAIHGFAPPPSHQRRIMTAAATQLRLSSSPQNQNRRRTSRKIDLDSPLFFSADVNNGDTDDDAMADNSDDSIAKETGTTAAAAPKASLLDKIKRIFKNDKSKYDDGLTTKEKLAKMGLSALLSYGWVSNMSYAITLSLSWYTHSKKTGLSPLAPNQWKPFLAVYAGFYVFNNIIRPLRFGLSVVVSRYFDNFVNLIQRKSGLGRKASIGVVVFLANVCGTFAAMGLGVSIASGLAGVPVFPPK